jgi:ADP-glucose pyrophosphorylase
LPAYRLIDLSNCLHRHRRRLGDPAHEPHELTKQLANGRPWDLTARAAGADLASYLGDSESGWYEGNADAIYSNRQVIADRS